MAARVSDRWPIEGTSMPRMGPAIMPTTTPMMM
ncbi:hypothetical protein QE410_002531 [Microbacterium sp. SORGH_AS 1204]|nr:hypothetical protein [Microbacterium sp. SORGH_AS_1204]